MTTAVKRRLKAFIIRWELWVWGLAAVTAVAAIPVLILVYPDVSNLTLSVIFLVGTIFSTIGSFASAIKANDTTE